MQYTSYMHQIQIFTYHRLADKASGKSGMNYWATGNTRSNWICRVQVGPGFTPKPFTIVSTNYSTFMFTLGSRQKGSSKDPLHHVVTTSQYIMSPSLAKCKTSNTLWSQSPCASTFFFSAEASRLPCFPRTMDCRRAEASQLGDGALTALIWFVIFCKFFIDLYVLFTNSVSLNNFRYCI